LIFLLCALGKEGNQVMSPKSKPCNSHRAIAIIGSIGGKVFGNWSSLNSST